ncbi:ead/Ea22-like family protein [Enterobacter hormaechei]|uniref:ead/Ea22-like family protein n=1 Tax=Enterobacter hormaechei TaxID=158836 RepID=UPI001680AD00
MSNIDKQALREAAERAESDSWGYDRDEFNEALTPSTVLALLDELEAKDKRIAELERDETQLIEERDSAEQALSDMYEAAMGDRPEWSNLFGYADAIDDVAQRVSFLDIEAAAGKGE